VILVKCWIRIKDSLTQSIATLPGLSAREGARFILPLRARRRALTHTVQATPSRCPAGSARENAKVFNVENGVFRVLANMHVLL
jgi:hypothetical protein